MAEHVAYDGQYGREIFEHKDSFSIGAALGVTLFFAVLSAVLWALVLSNQLMFKGGRVGCVLVGGPGAVVLMAFVLIRKITGPKRTTLFCENGILQVVDDAVLKFTYAEWKVTVVRTQEREWGTNFEVRGSGPDGARFVFEKTFLRTPEEREKLGFVRGVIPPVEKKDRRH